MTEDTREAREVVDVLVPSRLWRDNTVVGDLLSERQDLPASVGYRVLLGVAADLQPELDAFGRDLKARLLESGMVVRRSAMLPDSVLANQYLRIVDAHLPSGFVLLEEGVRVNRPSQVREASRQWRRLWNVDLDASESDRSVSELLSALETIAEQERSVHERSSVELRSLELDARSEVRGAPSTTGPGDSVSQQPTPRGPRVPPPPYPPPPDNGHVGGFQTGSHEGQATLVMHRVH